MDRYEMNSDANSQLISSHLIFRGQLNQYINVVTGAPADQRPGPPLHLISECVVD